MNNVGKTCRSSNPSLNRLPSPGWKPSAGGIAHGSDIAPDTPVAQVKDAERFLKERGL
jgi:hypothetical protein